MNGSLPDRARAAYHRCRPDQQVDSPDKDPLQRTRRGAHGAPQLPVPPDSASCVPGLTTGYVRQGCSIGVDAGLKASPHREPADVQGDGHQLRISLDKDEVRRIEPLLDASDFSSVVYEPQMGYAEPSTDRALPFASAARGPWAPGS